MRLMVHMGFHKTASTHLQDLLNRNSTHLAERGIWYERQSGYPAHHGIAHPLLLGDSAPLEGMIANARAAGCHTAILSSEDLEAAPFNPVVPALIEQVAADRGIERIEWHAVIREPGSYFESLYAQLSWHTFVDALHMFSEVMKKGVLFMPEPFHGEHATPYWFYCFDYQPFLAAFAAAGGRNLYVHDHADRQPYPGWRMLERLGALDAIVEQVEDNGFNRRLPAEDVAAFLCERLREVVDDEASWAMVREVAVGHIATDQATLALLAQAVGTKFDASYRAALRQFGKFEPDTSIAA
jgi:hypothetical protein